MIPNQTLLNRINSAAPDESSGTEIHRCKNLAKFIYDFAVQGGATGTTANLKDDQGNPAFLPVGAIITRSFVNVLTTFVGATATIAVQTVSAGDLLAATAVASFTAAANIEGKATGTAANFSGPVVATSVTLNGTQGGPVNVVIATAALTAGKMAIYVEYVI